MPGPTIFNIETGQWEEVSSGEAEAEYGIPIGEPVPSGSRATGGADVPGNEPPPYYTGGDREILAKVTVPETEFEGSERKTYQRFASNEPGVPADYDSSRSGSDILEEINREEETRENAGRVTQAEPTTTAPAEATLRKGYVLPPGMTLTEEQQQPQQQGRFKLPEGMTLDHPEEFAPQISYNVDLYPNIAQQRERYVNEIDYNPRLREFLAATVSLEAGDPDAVLGVVESLFNRTQMRNSSIAKQLTNGFYGPVNRGEVDRRIRNGVEPWMYEQLDNAMDAVRNGSDLIEGRTDQGMINEIHGPKARFGKEYFGYMDGDPSWSMKHQREKGEPGEGTRRRGGVAG
jgi:hypothetical protein